MDNLFHVTENNAISFLKNVDTPFVVVMENGTMKVEYFVPKNVDNQSPHLQDELYIITSGSSDFFRNGETIQCAKGDVIFVPAKMEHRFINFSNDFATWVIFYGKKAN